LTLLLVNVILYCLRFTFSLVKRWKGGMVKRCPDTSLNRPPKKPPTDYILRHPGLRAGIQSFRNNHPSPKQKTPDPRTASSRASRGPLGWQSPFATETGGLFKTGNSVASAEQTSAALILSAYICVNCLTQ